MDPTRYYHQQQEAKRLQNRISSFLEDFRVGTLLSGSNIRKLRGAKPLAVFTAIFTLPFVGANFSRGIVGNPGLGFRKDAAFEFLKNPRYNWRKFLLSLVTVVVRFMDVLTSEQREKVLIIDDSLYDRSRSKVVELLAWVHDHNAGRSLKGFKLLTLGWSDGVSFLPLDFTLCSSAKAGKRPPLALVVGDGGEATQAVGDHMAPGYDKLGTPGGDLVLGEAAEMAQFQVQGVPFAGE